MISHNTELINGKLVRHWDISQIRTLQDAEIVSAGDYLEYKDFMLEITWIGTVENTSFYSSKEIVFVGRASGISPWEKVTVVTGLNRAVYAWGPKGIASSFPEYKEGKMLAPEKSKEISPYFDWAFC